MAGKQGEVLGGGSQASPIREEQERLERLLNDVMFILENTEGEMTDEQVGALLSDCGTLSSKRLLGRIAFQKFLITSSVIVRPLLFRLISRRFVISLM